MVIFASSSEDYNFINFSVKNKAFLNLTLFPDSIYIIVTFACMSML